MIYHTTGKPTVKTEGEHIVVSFRSGNDRAEFPLTLDQTFHLYQMMQREALAAMRPGGFAHPEPAEEIRCELIAFSKRSVA